MSIVSFVITGLGDPLMLGHLAWPWRIKALVQHGDYVEILDTKDTSVISLEDISLGDLEFELDVFVAKKGK